jgi:hypothetical protein
VSAVALVMESEADTGAVVEDGDVLEASSNGAAPDIEQTDES